jgi:hypothetical protein
MRTPGRRALPQRPVRPVRVMAIDILAEDLWGARSLPGL